MGRVRFLAFTRRAIDLVVLGALSAQAEPGRFGAIELTRPV